jgi:hypothetical protein
MILERIKTRHPTTGYMSFKARLRCDCGCEKEYTRGIYIGAKHHFYSKECFLKWKSKTKK